jgi:hypothetical protein
MAIGKAVNTEAVDLVPKVLAGIPITISKRKLGSKSGTCCQEMQECVCRRIGEIK